MTGHPSPSPPSARGPGLVRLAGTAAVLVGCLLLALPSQAAPPRGKRAAPSPAARAATEPDPPAGVRIAPRQPESLVLVDDPVRPCDEDGRRKTDDALRAEEERNDRSAPRDPARRRAAIERLASSPDTSGDPDALLCLATLEGDAAAAPDRGPAIRRLQDLLGRFPAFDRAGRSACLLAGWLDEAGRSDEALPVYGRVVARHAGSPCADVAWYRVGTRAFDQGRFADAVTAYVRALENPRGRFRPAVLYRLSWARLRAGEYARGVAGFEQLLDELDPRQPGAQAFAALREAALDGLAWALANDDRDADGQRDADFGTARLVSFLPGGQPYEPEVLRRAGRLLLATRDPGLLPTARDAYGESVARAPLAPESLEGAFGVLEATDALGDPIRGAEVRLALARDFGAGSPWRAANADDAGRLAQADAAVDRALYEAALTYHRLAQEARTRAWAGVPSAAKYEAAPLYRTASAAYGEYLRRYPTGHRAYEATYSLAETLYQAGAYRDAGGAYARVRDWPGRDEHRADAAFNAIIAFEKAARAEECLCLRDLADPRDPAEAAIPAATPPEADAGDAVRLLPRPLPPPVQDWIRAADAFLAGGFERKGEAEFPAKLAFRVARELARYRHLGEARRRFEDLVNRNAGRDVARFAALEILHTWRREQNQVDARRWEERIRAMGGDAGGTTR